MDGASFARHYGDAFGFLLKLAVALLVVVLILGSWIVWDWLHTPSRSDFEREAIEHGVAGYDAKGNFRWVDVEAEYQNGVKAGSEQVYRYARERGITIPAN